MPINSLKTMPVPTQDWMLVEEEELDTSIVIPDTINKFEQLSQFLGHKVISMGPWKETHDDHGHLFEHGIKVGDVVIIEGLNAPCFEYRGRKFWIVRARYVCCIINKKEG